MLLDVKGDGLFPLILNLMKTLSPLWGDRASSGVKAIKSLRLRPSEAVRPLPCRDTARDFQLV